MSSFAVSDRLFYCIFGVLVLLLVVCARSLTWWMASLRGLWGLVAWELVFRDIWFFCEQTQVSESPPFP